MIWQLRQEQAKTCYVLFVTVNLFKKHCHGFKGVSSILEHTASDGNFSKGNPIKSRINNIPHSSDDKCRAIQRWGTNITFFKKTYTCNYLVGTL